MKYLKSVKRSSLSLYRNYKRNAVRHLNKKRTWTTLRKIIVFDSDDWGSIRMPNQSVFDACLKAGIPVDNDLYARYDTLASNQDFEALYEVLQRHKDALGRSPSITANVVMANPDFKKIREANFEEYHFELFTETLKRYPNRNFEIWKQGVDENLLCPELHGREHLKVISWLNALKADRHPFRLAFNHDFFALSRRACPSLPENFLSALNYTDKEGQSFAFQSVQESVDLFQQVFNYTPHSFIAPNYCWDENVEQALADKGIFYIKGKEYQKHPVLGRRYHYTGKRNDRGQIYLVRNINFEPCTSLSRDWVGETLREIKKAFDRRQPAVICTHRLNYIGSLQEKNRTRTLKILDELLRAITKRWPEIEFLNASKLMEELQNSN